MSIGTKLFTWFKGKRVGQDSFGNVYYEEKRPRKRMRRRRWVAYKGRPEGSAVPPAWHGWLHYTTDNVPESDAPVYAWQKPYEPNPTGTAQAYVPPGHPARGGHRDGVSADYQPWQPAE